MTDVGKASPSGKALLKTGGRRNEPQPQKIALATGNDAGGTSGLLPLDAKAFEKYCRTSTNNKPTRVASGSKW